MSPRRIVLAAIILIGFSRCCDATQIVVVVAHDGIVVASDSKQRERSGSDLGVSPEPANKVIIMNDLAAVAVVGTGNMRFTRAAEVVYSFDSMALLDGIKHSLPANAPISLIESVIVDKLKSTMDSLSPYVANGFFNKQNAPEGDIVDFVLIGYERRIPTVLNIRVECDWDTRKIATPIVESMNPLPNRPVDSNILFFGRSLSILNAADPASAERKAATERYPGAISGLDVSRTSRAVSSTEGLGIAADLIRLEAEFGSEYVGPPINIVVLSTTDAPRVSVLAK